MVNTYCDGEELRRRGLRREGVRALVHSQTGPGELHKVPRRIQWYAILLAIPSIWYFCSFRVGVKAKYGERKPQKYTSAHTNTVIKTTLMRRRIDCRESL